MRFIFLIVYCLAFFGGAITESKVTLFDNHKLSFHKIGKDKNSNLVINEDEENNEEEKEVYLIAKKQTTYLLPLLAERINSINKEALRFKSLSYKIYIAVQNFRI